jgi:hypothetical protein
MNLHSWSFDAALRMKLDDGRDSDDTDSSHSFNLAGGSALSVEIWVQASRMNSMNCMNGTSIFGSMYLRWNDHSKLMASLY